MTPEERQALREKHQPSVIVDGQRHCSGCSTRRGMVVAACLQLYPCDTIKVLDAYEALDEYHSHDGSTDREDPWCHTCNKEWPCEKGLSLGQPYGVA